MWTEEDERLLRTLRGRWLDCGLTPYREMRRWRRLALASLAVAGVQAVVIAAILIRRWLQ